MSEQEWLDIFGDNLADIMAEKGYSQSDLADATGLSISAISNYINKKKIPTVRAIINMAYELDLSFDEFIDFGDRVY